MSERVLVIDEDLPPHLANALLRRGRRATSVQDLRLKSSLDPYVIRKVFGFYDDPVLITGDNDMPAEHASVLAEVNATVAVVKPWSPEEGFVSRWEGQDHRGEDEWEHEVVQRWAHSIQGQVTGTVRRYSLSSHAPWRPPRRPRKRK